LDEYAQAIGTTFPNGAPPGSVARFLVKRLLTSDLYFHEKGHDTNRGFVPALNCLPAFVGTGTPNHGKTVKKKHFTPHEVIAFVKSLNTGTPRGNVVSDMVFRPRI
jgi:hypothetical protein